jgi:predicted nicotinamide N-methyase
MGNNHQKQSKTDSPNKEHTTKVILQLNVQEIIIHHAFSMKLKLAEVQTFPHGLDGLKIWEAGIVLARYAVLNCKIFKEKEVLELGSGVGIAGIAIKKWT